MPSKRLLEEEQSGLGPVMRTVLRKCRFRTTARVSMRSSRTISSKCFTRQSPAAPDWAWRSRVSFCATREGTFPIAQPNEERHSSLRCRETNMPISTVLVAEDEQAARMSLAELLEAEGFRVLTAEEREQALSLTLREEPDAVLLDIRLPR